jgi:thiol-disulfide isomerase/thioredoxin
VRTAVSACFFGLLVIAPMGAVTSSLAAEEARTASKPVPAKEFFSFEINAIEGGKIRTADLLGKLVVVDVWGTWCGPCRQVIPHLVAIQKEFGPKGVVVVGISAERGMDYSTAVRRVMEFAREIGINYRLGWLNDQVQSDVKRIMHFEGDSFTVPATIVLDRDGSILARYPGYFFGQEKEIAELIRQRLVREARKAESGH